MKETLTRKIARELSDYFKLNNKDRSEEKQKKLILSIQQTDKILKQLKEEEKQPEIPGINAK